MAIFNNAKELAKYLVDIDDRKVPKELVGFYYQNNPYWSFKRNIINLYEQEKSIQAQECNEYVKAKEKAIEFLEQKLLELGYNLAIEYSAKCVYADGRETIFKVNIQNIPQQLSFL